MTSVLSHSENKMNENHSPNKCNTCNRVFTNPIEVYVHAETSACLKRRGRKIEKIEEETFSESSHTDSTGPKGLMYKRTVNDERIIEQYFSRTGYMMMLNTYDLDERLHGLCATFFRDGRVCWSGEVRSRQESSNGNTSQEDYFKIGLQ